MGYLTDVFHIDVISEFKTFVVCPQGPLPRYDYHENMGSRTQTTK